MFKLTWLLSCARSRLGLCFCMKWSQSPYTRIGDYTGDLRHFDITVRCAAHYAWATLNLHLTFNKSPVLPMRTWNVTFSRSYEAKFWSPCLLIIRSCQRQSPSSPNFRSILLSYTMWKAFDWRIHLVKTGGKNPKVNLTQQLCWAQRFFGLREPNVLPCWARAQRGLVRQCFRKTVEWVVAGSHRTPHKPLHLSLSLSLSLSLFLSRTFSVFLQCRVPCAWPDFFHPTKPTVRKVNSKYAHFQVASYKEHLGFELLKKRSHVIQCSRKL